MTDLPPNGFRKRDLLFWGVIIVFQTTFPVFAGRTAEPPVPPTIKPPTPPPPPDDEWLDEKCVKPNPKTKCRVRHDPKEAFAAVRDATDGSKGHLGRKTTDTTQERGRKSV